MCAYTQLKSKNKIKFHKEVRDSTVRPKIGVSGVKDTQKVTKIRI